MKGYKAFNKDLKCRGMQYEIGGTYELGDSPICCERGFHFCKTISDCYNFYPRRDKTRICEVEALGEVVTEDGVKYCTDIIHVIREVENPRMKTNANETSTGYCNSGYYNAGDYNSGNLNSGCRNAGNRNSGHRNRGNFNSGNFNSGDFNSGDFNSGKWNSGVFNTRQIPTIKMFDKDSDWTINDWLNSNAYGIMKGYPVSYSDFIYECDMSEVEKINHPEYKTLGGYTKTITATPEDKQKWWDNLSDNDKQAVMSLPNFDTYKFYQCTGIMV